MATAPATVLSISAAVRRSKPSRDSNSRRKSPKPPGRISLPADPVPGSQATTFTRLPLRESPDPLPEIPLSLFPVHRPEPHHNSHDRDLPENDDEEIWEQLDEDEEEFGNGLGFGEEDDGEMEIMEMEGSKKEKGVPAVMRCFDRAKIYVKAGDGGNGVVAFRREKFVPYGGPSGGDGGRGGNVYVEVDGAMNSLLPFRKAVHFRAGPGGHGQGSKQSGAKGEDVIIRVAPGTVVREAGGEEVLLEMMRPGQRAMLLAGGRGGRGNASFKTGVNKVPKIAENGEEGPEM